MKLMMKLSERHDLFQTIIPIFTTTRRR